MRSRTSCVGPPSERSVMPPVVRGVQRRDELSRQCSLVGADEVDDESAGGELLAQLAHPEPEARRPGNLGDGSKDTGQIADLDVLDPDDLAGRLARWLDREARPAGGHRAEFLDLAVARAGIVVPSATATRIVSGRASGP